FLKSGARNFRGTVESLVRILAFAPMLSFRAICHCAPVGGFRVGSGTPLGDGFPVCPFGLVVNTDQALGFQEEVLLLGKFVAIVVFVPLSSFVGMVKIRLQRPDPFLYLCVIGALGLLIAAVVKAQRLRVACVHLLSTMDIVMVKIDLGALCGTTLRFREKVG